MIVPHYACRGVPCLLLTLLIVFGVAGCGGTSDGPNVAVVSGQVTLKGNPLASAGVSFRPDAAKGNKTKFIPSATANEDGEYELMTGDKKGAPVGWYKVVVVAPSPAMVAGEAPKSGPPPFNSKYSDPATTPFSVEVKETNLPEPYDLNITN
jgi:hypothetical protein